MIYRDHNAGVA